MTLERRTTMRLEIRTEDVTGSPEQNLKSSVLCTTPPTGGMTSPREEITLHLSMKDGARGWRALCVEVCMSADAHSEATHIFT